MHARISTAKVDAMKRLSHTLIFALLAAAVQAEEQSVNLDGEQIRFDELITADESRDGVNDRISCYLRGKLVLSIYDINDDGTPDMWRTYDDEIMKVEIKDTTGDGNPDTYYDYDRKGRRIGKRRAGKDRTTAGQSPTTPATAPAPAADRGKPALRARKTKRYRRVWTDKGSGAKNDFAVFRARTEAGFYPLGDTAVAGPWPGARYAAPNAYAVLIGNGTMPVLPPVDYRLIWSSRGSPADKPFSSWQPIAPSGYRCLGDVGSIKLSNKPPLDAIRCVPQRCAQRSDLTRKIWDDEGSNARDDFSAWGTKTPGVYAGRRGQGRPRREIFQLRESCLTAGG